MGPTSAAPCKFRKLCMGSKLICSRASYYVHRSPFWPTAMLLTLWLAAIGVVPHDLALAFAVDSVITYLALKTCWGCVRCPGRQSDSPPPWDGWPSEEAHGDAREGAESVLPEPCLSQGGRAPVAAPRWAPAPVSRKESPSPSTQRRRRVLDSPQVRPAAEPGKRVPRIGKPQPHTIPEKGMMEQQREEKNARTGSGVCVGKAQAAGTVVLEGMDAHNPPLGMEVWSRKMSGSE